MEPLQTSKEPPTPRQLVDLVGTTLESVLPAGWRGSVQGSSRSADAFVVVTAPDGRSAELPVEARTNLDARDVPLLEARRKRGSEPFAAAPGIIVARYLSPRAREALAAAGFSYVDATGNVRLAIDEPGLFVVLVGADRDPWRSPDRPTNSLRGRPAARIVRTLVDRSPPWKVRELAQQAGTSLGSTSRTVDFLTREALVERDDTGAIVGVLWPELLQRWAADYDLTRRRRSVGLLAPRGLDSLRAPLRGWEGEYAITGSLAAAQWAPYADARLAIIYTPEADLLESELNLRVAPSRPNVLVIEPDDDYVFMRAQERDGLRYAAPSQVVVDLLAGAGRNPSEGMALIDWMRANEPSWRES